MKEKLIVVAKIAKPHGIKGELCLDYFADTNSLLKGIVFLQSKENEVVHEVKVLSFRLHQGRPLVFFEGIDNRTIAEDYRGFRVLVKESKLPELQNEEVYVHNLIGLKVFLTEGNKKLGVLEDINVSSLQELWIIRTKDDKEILFPATQEFVDKIDLDVGNIFITPPEGLLELYL